MLGGMLTKDRKPPDGFSDWDSFYEHGAREILPKLEPRSPAVHVRDVVNTPRAAPRVATPGSSRSQAEVHERVAEHILEGDVFDLVATILRDLVTPFVVLNYGADAAVPGCAPQLEANGQRAFQLEGLKVGPGR